MRFVIFQDRSGAWRWHLKSRNHKIMSDGGEGYTEERHARAAVEKIIERIQRGDVEVL